MQVVPEQQASKQGASEDTAKPAVKHRVGRHWRIWVVLIRYARAFLFLINVRTLALATLACLMVYFCESMVLDLRFKMEFSIISVGTVFPLVFSIQQAFQRREEALRQLSVLRGQLMGIYFCHRDWDVSDGVKVRANLGNDEAPHAVRAAELITQLMATLKRWLVGRTAFESEAEWRMLYGTTGLAREITHQLSGDFFRGEEVRVDRSDSDEDEDDGGEGEDRKGGREGAGEAAGGKEASGAIPPEEMAEQDPHWQLYFQMYDVLSEMSVHNEDLTTMTGCTKAGEAGMSRLHAYLIKTVEVLERLRCLREYRTPFLLRYVSFVLVLASIFLAAPYFAYMCNDSPRWADDRSGRCPAGYFTAVIYVMVVSMLFHVQVALENPFDGIGMDDVFINMDREFAVTVRRYSRSRAAAKEAAAAAELDKLSSRGSGERAAGADSGLKTLSILVDTSEGGAASGAPAGQDGAAGRVPSAAAAAHVYGPVSGGSGTSRRPASGRQGSGRPGSGGHGGASRLGSSLPREPSPAWGSIKLF